jgi:homoserine kinase
MKSIQNVPALPLSNLDLANVSVVVTHQKNDVSAICIQDVILHPNRKRYVTALERMQTDDNMI